MVVTRRGVWPHIKAGCRLALLVAASVAPGSGGHSAEQASFDAARSFVETHVREWLSDPLIIATVKTQNASHRLLTATDITNLDREWVKEINSGYRPMLTAAMERPLSRYLKQKAEQSAGAITELIVMDAQGLNAGQSDPTSDYWQGDEDKFMRTYPQGPRAVFVDQPRMDESTRLLQSQVSLTLVDEAGHPIGAITIGINLDQL